MSMFIKSIPRGIIYHNVRDEVIWLFESFFKKLDDRKVISEFEHAFSSYMGSKHCVTFPFARTALYYTLKALKLPAGSEVLMPPVTIKAILDVVLALDLKPVFVDINNETLCFDFEKLKNAVNNNTKVALITYLFGMVPNVKKMTDYLKLQGVFVVEDFSQCLDGKFDGKKIGTFGDVGIYSASSIKTLDTFGGGILVSDNDDIVEILQNFQASLTTVNRQLLIKTIITDLIRNIATTRFIFNFFTFPLIKIIDYFKPASFIKHTGRRNKDMLNKLPDIWFCTYTSFQAKIGLKLLERVETSNLKRIKNAELIKDNVKGINFPKGVLNGRNVYWQLVAFFEDASVIQRFLHSHKIDTATTSLELVSSLNKYPYKRSTPNAKNLYLNGLFVPAFPGLKQSDLNRIYIALNDLGKN